MRAGLGYIPQERAGFAQLTVAENLRVVLETRSGGQRSEIDEVLDLFPRLQPLVSSAPPVSSAAASASSWRSPARC